MGTTKDAFLAGSTSFVWVVAIEGYERLLTNGDPAAAVTAWAGTDWSAASGGLFVELSVDQSLSPDTPMPRMGSCMLWVVPTPGDDTFGVAVGRKTSTFETYLDATLDNDGTTVTVKSTLGAASSGTIHIGTEAIAYSSTTPTTFVVAANGRGKYSPFGSFADLFSGFATGRHFSHYHRVGPDAYSVKLQPLVTSTQKTWAGRWVGVWAHRVVNGVLDTRDQAELVFAGKINEPRDDANTFATVIQVTGVTEVFADAAIGGSQWEGKASSGIYLSAGQVFGARDLGVGTHEANRLEVVPFGASGSNQMNEGEYSLSSLCSRLNTWLAAELAAGRMQASLTLTSPVVNAGRACTSVLWTLTAGGTDAWNISTPAAVATFLGFTANGSDFTIPGNVSWGYVGPGGSGKYYYSPSSPASLSIVVDGGPSARVRVNTTSGTALDQYDTMPSEARPFVSLGLAWGLFLVGDSRLVYAAIQDNGDGTIDLLFIQPAFQDPTKDPPPDYTAITVADGAELVVRQIYAFESDPVGLLTSLAISCGTQFYNTPGVSYPFGCGASIPYELVQNMSLTLSGIPALSSTVALIVEKPTKLSELMNSDLGFRWAFLHWHNGSIEGGAWKTPSATLAQVLLDETNKGEPADNKVNQRTATTESTEWIRQIVKIRYNRNATDTKGDGYKSSIQFEDRVAVDDAGGAPNTITLSLRNTYSEFSATGQSVEAQLPNYLALMPLVSRPARKATRSIDPRMFLALGLGDVVLLTDTFARDPESGLRGITERPALVTRLRYNFGGFTAGTDKATPPGGEVDLFFTDVNPDRVGAAYVPAADVNDLYSVGSFFRGYDATSFILHCLTHRYSETTEVADAARFSPGDKILIVEIDPLDPDNPVKWERTIAANGVAGDELTLTAGLSSPAWDVTTWGRKYHVIAQDYAAATATQRTNVFQADDATGLIVATAQPFLYGTGSADQTFTTNAAMEARYPFSTPTAIELPANSRYADGAGRDVAHEAGLIRLVDNGIDYKSAMQLPMLGPVASNTTYSTGGQYQLSYYFPLFLSNEILSNAIFRNITIAPWAYSTDGTPTKLRATISRERPSFPTTEDVPWQGIYGQYEWTNITSTTPGQLADGVISANVKHPITGQAWVAIELGFKCATRGLAKFIEGARQTQ